MTTKESPAITKSEFDATEASLRRDLERWWEAEKEDITDEEPAPPDPETDALWEGLPEIDSKAVVKASPVVRAHLGVDLDPRLIRRGGYNSFDDLMNDLIPKLRSSCPDVHPPTDPIGSTEGAPTNV